MIIYMNLPVTRMRLMKTGVISWITVIDKLGSNRRAKAKHHFSATHEQGSSYINRCKNSHLPVHRWDCKMQRSITLGSRYAS